MTIVQKEAGAPRFELDRSLVTDGRGPSRPIGGSTYLEPPKPRVKELPLDPSI